MRLRHRARPGQITSARRANWKRWQALGKVGDRAGCPHLAFFVGRVRPSIYLNTV
jgi:hypothetical protein